MTEKQRYQLVWIVRRLSGIAVWVFLIMIYGKAGASDCGAPLEEIFPSTFIYVGLMILSFLVWKFTGGE